MNSNKFPNNLIKKLFLGDFYCALEETNFCYNFTKQPK